jgi:hypothetical protein
MEGRSYRNHGRNMSLMGRWLVADGCYRGVKKVGQVEVP